LTALIQNQHGASSTLKIDGDIPLGRLNPLILDGATHGIPHDRLHLWDPIFSPDKVAYPALIPEMNFYGPTPKNGDIRCEVRPDGYLGDPSFPAFRIQLIGEQGVWCSFRLIEAAFPKGKIGGASPENRRLFLRDKQFIAGLRLSEEKDSRTILREEDVTEVSWLPGTVKAIFGSESIADIAQKEHIAAAHHIHPLYLPEALPLTQFELNVQEKKGLVMVEGSGLGRLNIEPVRDFWSNWFNRGPWAVEDLYYGLCQRFINRVVLADPESFEAYKGQSMLFVANHQVGVESLLFSIIASGLSTVPTVTLAKIEHKETWLGKLIDHCFRYPNVQDPKVITFFDRQDKSSLTNIIKEFAQEMATNQRSIMIHIEGTRSLDCATPVQKMSGAFLDMAIQVGAPVVPVRFVGGLPREKMEKRIEFPINMGKQDIYFGKPISAAELSSLHYGDRKNLVIDAINDLGPNNADEQPYPGDSDFSEKVARWQKKHTVTEEHAALACILSEQENSCEEIQRLLKATTLSELADGEIGNWLTELGRRLIGET
jgi:1-acyl-sn-glycerol-3-phosphate acyltransferase